MVTNISREELDQRISRGDITVVEALPIEHWKKGHLPGAIAFPLDDIDGLAAQVLPDRSATISVYCSNASCQNSHQVAARLDALGYTDIRRYVGGKEDWAGAGLPTEQDDTARP